MAPAASARKCIGFYLLFIFQLDKAIYVTCQQLYDRSHELGGCYLLILDSYLQIVQHWD